MRRVVFASVVLLVSCAHREAAAPLNVAPPPPMSAPGGPAPIAPSAARSPPYQVGLATWYGGSFAGKKTSNGERFNPRAMTAAHLRLPFGTWVEVRRVDTGRTVRVRINDRGPWHHPARIINLSQAAAERLDMIPLGPTKVEIWVVPGPE